MKIKRLLKEASGVDEMRFDVTVFFDTKQTSQMDPHRIEADLQNLLENILEGDEASEFGIDSIRVRRDG